MAATKTRAELETLIRASAADRTWSVFSEDPKFIRRMAALFGPGRKVSAVGYAWTVPLKAIRPRITRTVQGAQRDKLVAKLQGARGKISPKSSQPAEGS